MQVLVVVVVIKEEYCTSEKMNLRCVAPNSVILISKALYGRLRAGRCITSDYAHAIGCYSDVSSYLESVCSGHRECSMLVATVDSVAQPCPKDFKSYLEVTYVCAPGELIVKSTEHLVAGCCFHRRLCVCS